jgi:imidazolonepropionase
MSGETPTCDRLWTQARLATMSPGIDAPYGAVEDGVVAARDGRIVYAGPRSQPPSFHAAETID